MNIPTQLMTVNLSFDLNTETEYHSPASAGVEDMRSLLNRLETMQMDNTPFNTVVNGSFDNIGAKLSKSHKGPDLDLLVSSSEYAEMFEYFMYTAIYDPIISNEIRIGILNVLRMLIPINNTMRTKPEQVLAAWYLIKPLVIECIQQTKSLSSYKKTFDRLMTIKQYISMYISKNTKIDPKWSAWQENYYIIYTMDYHNYFRDLISNWESISIGGMPFLKHKNSLDAFKNIAPKQWVKGDILHDISNHKTFQMRTQICTSDLADQVGEVQP